METRTERPRLRRREAAQAQAGSNRQSSGRAGAVAWRAHGRQPARGRARRRGHKWPMQGLERDRQPRETSAEQVAGRLLAGSVASLGPGSLIYASPHLTLSLNV